MNNEIAFHVEHAERQRRLTRDHAARQLRREHRRTEPSAALLRRRWDAVVATLRHHRVAGRPLGGISP